MTNSFAALHSNELLPLDGDAALCQLTVLLRQLHDCLTNPDATTMGTLAETVQALRASLAQQADTADDKLVPDWDYILSDGDGSDRPAASFTADQLSALSGACSQSL